MNSVFEKFLRIKGYDIKSSEHSLNKIKNLSRDEFLEWKLKQKFIVARYHFNNNNFYRKKVGKFFPEKWEELPILNKKDFQQDLNIMLSNGYSRKNVYISNTSGSSGRPFFFAKNKEAHAMDWALIKDRYSWHNLNLNSKQARFFGIPLESFSYIKEKMKDLLMNRKRFSIYNLSDRILWKYFEQFKKIEFDYIYGYTNSLVLFARFLIKNNIVLKDICPTISTCITTSEVVTAEDRLLINKGFGVKVINEYGASELGIIAFENIKDEWELSEEILYYETLNESGKNALSGNLILTDLDNLAMPFIRYNIGDIGIIKESHYPNYKNKQLYKLLGRENDTIYLPSGKISPGFTLYYVSRSILESTGVLKEYLIRQTKINEFIFEIVTDDPLSHEQESIIKEKVEKYLEPGLNIIFKRMDTINRPASGKIKHFISELDKNK
tara:strand:- start:1027 stop:2343 length:1317 start_codon:yes stop_codon:yes gene_type:complete